MADFAQRPPEVRNPGACLILFEAAILRRKPDSMVNAIAPTLVETEMVTSNPNARPGLIPVGRFGTVEETAMWR